QVALDALQLVLVGSRAVERDELVVRVDARAVRDAAGVDLRDDEAAVRLLLRLPAELGARGDLGLDVVAPVGLLLVVALVGLFAELEPDAREERGEVRRLDSAHIAVEERLLVLAGHALDRLLVGPLGIADALLPVLLP